MHKLRERFGAGIEPVQTIPGTHPKHAAAIFVECRDHVGAQAVGIVRFVFEAREPFGCPVEAVEATAGRAEPEPAAAVFQQGENIVISQRGRLQRVVPVDGHACSRQT